MSFQVRVKFWLGFNLGEGKQQVILTHGHDFELCILRCKEVRKIYRDCSYHYNCIISLPIKPSFITLYNIPIGRKIFSYYFLAYTKIILYLHVKHIK